MKMPTSFIFLLFSQYKKNNNRRYYNHTSLPIGSTACISSPCSSSQRMFARKRHFVLVLFYFLAVFLQQCRANGDDYDEFMREVVEEAQEYMIEEEEDDDDNDVLKQTMDMEEELRRRQEQQQHEEQQRQAEQEHMENERVQMEREALFEAELQRMSEEKQKEAIRRKKKDGAIVRRVLQAAERGDHYGTLGIRNMELQIPSISIKLGRWIRTFPAISLFRVSGKAIRKAYRNMALVVHPDKNRDGRAVQAFVAVENAASILVDETTRVAYDSERLLLRKQRTQAVRRMVGSSASRVVTATKRSIWVFRKVLGPFAFPVAIIGILIV